MYRNMLPIKIRDIPKLDEANALGDSGKKSSSFTLIVTEGDSTKTLAIARLA